MAQFLGKAMGWLYNSSCLQVASISRRKKAVDANVDNIKLVAVLCQTREHMVGDGEKEKGGAICMLLARPTGYRHDLNVLPMHNLNNLL